VKRLLILKTGSTLVSLRGSVGDFEDWIVRVMAVRADDVVCCAVYLGEPLPALDEVAGIVITGSPAMVTDGARWNHVAMAYLSQAIERELPVLGICYGHQLLALALGGEVGYHPAGREIGTVAISRTDAEVDDVLLRDAPQCFLAHTSHSQSVLTLPKGATVLARSEHDAHQCYRVGQKVWGVQFHPEFDAHIMRRYVSERAQNLKGEGLDCERILASVEETPEAARVLERFARVSGL
jgi:GMP synthase (glutamine-hydrolysing)